MESPAFEEAPEGNAHIETYTVCFGKNGPERAIIIGRLDQDGRRFVANAPTEPQILNDILDRDSLGRPGVVSSSGNVNIFRPH